MIECLLISSIPGEALRMHVESRGLISRDVNLVFYLSVNKLVHCSI